MRISQAQATFFKQFWENRAEVYLFGSRTNDHAKGGDIDLLLLSDTKITLDEKMKFVSAFYKSFGEQKIDVVSFTHQENDPFKIIALDGAVRL